MSHQYRIKAASHGQVYAEFTDDVDPKNIAACNTLLAHQIETRRLKRRLPVQLQVKDRYRRWVDIGSPVNR